ncbi:MAG TPA: glycoside hydrolase family 20 zincin-like fold domain-containing protein, partial [Mucilaginibacter sp.]
MIKPLKACYLLFQVLLSIFVFSNVFAQTKEQGIIPQPYKIVKGNGVFTFRGITAVALGDGVDVGNLTFFKQYLKAVSGADLSVNNKMVNPAVNINIDSSGITQKEGYRLSVTPKHISITGHDQAGVFYGLQSLIQL